MSEWVAIALRFGVYLDLMLLFGLIAYPLYSVGRASLDTEHGRFLPLALAMLGIVLSIASFIVMAASMAGVAVAELDSETLAFVLQETGHGAAFKVQVIALVVAAGLALIGRGVRGRWLTVSAAGVALGSLAWTGHAGATEEWPGALHRLSDIVHLLAAAAWLGALVILLGAVVKADVAVSKAHEALTTFAVAGSVIVALIIVTGVVNSVMIVGVAGLPLLPYTLYGQLLIAKLGLFALMLVLASLNRWRLTPRLGLQRANGEGPPELKAVRQSLVLETGAACMILGLVGWLGTLAPPSP